MKKLWENEKMRRLLITNAVAYGIKCVFIYGIMCFLFLPIYFWLTVRNYKKCEKLGQFLNMQAFLIVCMIVTAGWHMLCFNHDNLSQTIIVLLLVIEVGVHLITTAFAAVMKWRDERKQMREEEKANRP